MSAYKSINTIQLFLENKINSSMTELKSLSQFFVNQTEGKRHHDAKEIFNSTYTLTKKNDQFRHIMVCLKISNNVTKNCCLCQSLYDFI